MLEMTIYQNEQFGQLRTTTKDGEPWFVAADVCRALDLGRTWNALQRLDEDEKGTSLISTPGGEQNFSIVSEPGLYALVLGSRKPEAKAFKRWVTHDVLPAIRQTGGYGAKEERQQLPEELRPELYSLMPYTTFKAQKWLYEVAFPALQAALDDGRAYLAPKGSTVYTTTDAVCIGHYVSKEEATPGEPRLTIHWKEAEQFVPTDPEAGSGPYALAFYGRMFSENRWSRLQLFCHMYGLTR